MGLVILGRRCSRRCPTSPGLPHSHGKARHMPPVSSPGLGTPSDRSPGSRRGAREAALARVRFRRAVTLLVMTLLVPGSAQLAAGRRDVGRVALRVWLSVICGFVFVVLLGMVWHGFVYWMASNT